MPMPSLPEQQAAIAAAREKLRAVVGRLPAFGAIAGTGLTGLTDDMEIAGRAPYSALGFPASTVAGHPGELVWGTIHGRAAFVLRGRFHLYEGYAPQEIAMPIRALAAEGMKYLVVTNASGGLRRDFRPGDVMAIRDHINATGRSPLVGPHDPAWGPRFPDMSKVWDPRALAILEKAATAQRLPLRQGTYIGVHGPQLETPAETRIYRDAGADAIGMSTVMEVIAAAQAGVRLAGLAAITNVNDPEAMAEVSLDEIVANADRAAPALRRLVAALAAEWE